MAREAVGVTPKVRLPTADDSELPSARSGAPIASYDVSAIGEGMANMGQAVAKVGFALADNWDKQKEQGIAAKWLNFQYQEDQAYDAATKSLKPAEAQGFGDRHLAGYKQRAEGFWNGLPDNLKEEYQVKILAKRNALWSSGVSFERQSQSLAALETEDAAVNGPLLGRVASAAGSADTDYAKEAILSEIDAEVDALVERNPARSETEKAARKKQIRATLYKAFLGTLARTNPAAALTADPNIGDQTVGERVTSLPSVSSPFADDATWEATVRQYRPDLVTGRTRQEILELRADPILIAGLADKRAQEGGKYLAARGYTANQSNQLLAYAAGNVAAAELLGAEGMDYADVVAADAAAANPAMFYKPGADGKPDPNQPRTVSELRAWADQAMAGTAHVDWGRRLAAGLTYEQRVAAAGDAGAAMVKAREAATKAAKDQYDWQFKNLELKIEGGFAGEADIQDAVKGGWLKDRNDIIKLINLNNKKRAEGVNLNVAWQRFNNRDLDGYSTKDKSDANLVYSKGMGGAKGLLDDRQPSGPNDGPQPPTKAEELFAFVDRAGMVPDDAVAELKLGIDDQKPETMAKAYVLMDAMRRRNRVVFENAFDKETVQRLDLYQELAPRVPAEVLMEELSAHVSPQVMKAREELRKEGEALAAINGPGDMAFIGGDEILRLLGGSSLPADPTMYKAMRGDFETNFAIAYSRTRSVESAKKLATMWMQSKWDKTEIGSDVTVMPYPPERYYPAIDGDRSWIDDQLEAFVEAQVPDHQGFWIVADPQTEADVTAKRPPRYQVGVMGGDGIYRILGSSKTDPRPMLIEFNPDRAKADRRKKFEQDRLTRPAPTGGATGTVPSPVVPPQGVPPIPEIAPVVPPAMRSPARPGNDIEIKTIP